MSRPLVSVYDAANADSKTGSVKLPGVFTAPIRIDVVHDIHTKMAKNARQPYAVSKYAGEQTSAESWGTGRAVARIPRVAGSGTHRSGQGAFGNMCRGGRMYAPTKVWRSWHVRISVGQRRFATVAALAASASAPIVLARGHHIEEIPEVPLVVSNAAESITKTGNAVKLLRRFGAGADLDRVIASKTVRAGKGKARNRRYKQKVGPLVVYNKDEGITRAFRNIPGVDLCDVKHLNLLQLAPGGHVGRFIVWTEGAFSALDGLWGTQRALSEHKKGYRVPRAPVNNADITRVINSAEVQSVLRPRQERPRPKGVKPNPLRNAKAMAKLNPFALQVLRAATPASGVKKAAAKPRSKKNAEADKKRERKRAAAKRAFSKRLHD